MASQITNSIYETWTDSTEQIVIQLNKDKTGYINILSKVGESLYYYGITQWSLTTENTMNIIFGSSNMQQVTIVPNPITINISYSNNVSILDNLKDIITYSKTLKLDNVNISPVLNTTYYSGIVSVLRCNNRKW